MHKRTLRQVQVLHDLISVPFDFFQPVPFLLFFEQLAAASQFVMGNYTNKQTNKHKYYYLYILLDYEYLFILLL